jgi:signal transduction histidine kinase/ligand-binding sensor domain-containing protein
MLKKIIFCVVFHLIVIQNYAQSEEFMFKNYDIQDGLCDNTVNSIIEDQKGFIWIGTREGLSRFDGAEFKNFYFSEASQNIGNYYSSFIQFESDKILLLNNSKLAILNTSTNTLKVVPALKNYSISTVTDIGNSMYALHIKNYLLIVNKKFEILDKIQFDKVRNAFLSVQKLSDKKLLINNFYNFYEYNISTKKLAPFYLDLKRFFNPPFNTFQIKRIDEKRQFIYVSDFFSGLYIFDYKGTLVTKYSHQKPPNTILSSNVLSIVETNDNRTWLATDRGISIINSNGKTIAIEHDDNNRLSLKSDVVTCLYVDKNNNIWIGTNQGISVYKNSLNKKVKKQFYTSNPLENVSNIAFVNDELFVGSYLNKTYKINQNTGKIEPLVNTPGAWSIKKIDDKIYIYGSNKKIATYDPKTKQYTSTDFLKKYFSNSDIITLAFKHSSGDMWYSGNSGGGFVRVVAYSKQIEHYKRIENNKVLFASSYYHEAAEDAEKNMWFGVNKSSLLLKWNYKTKAFQEIDFNSKKNGGKTIFGGIVTIKSDDEKNLWIAFEGGGIIKFDPAKNTVDHFTIENGLNTSFINNIEFDTKKRLWILTNKGVSCLNTVTKTFHHMDVWDGFTDNPITYNVLKMDPNRNLMWIGSTNCLYSFNPDKIIKNKLSTTKIYLDGVKVNNSNYINLSATPFRFKPNENNLEFDIVAVDIENGENLEYSYKLEGFNNQWINLRKDKSILFPKLNAGYYTFNARVRTKGSNNWIYLSQPFSFSIDNYWYQTLWFKTLLVLGVLALTFFIISLYFRRKLEKQKVELEKQKAIEDERKRIAKDMHDDLGSGLTKITYLSQMAMLNKTSDENIVNINKTSTELVESMSEIIWVMKDENNSWEELLLFIKKYAVDYCGNNNLSVHFDYPETLVQTELSGEKRRNIFLSIKEVLHNIVKHSKATDVTVTVQQNNKVHIIIADNGIGINTSKRQKSSVGNGQKNISERMKLVNATFSIEENNGTKIHFVIPI